MNRTSPGAPYLTSGEFLIIKCIKLNSGMKMPYSITKYVVGKYYDKGKWHDTTKVAIHHGGKGSHMVPIKGNNFD